MISKLYAMVGYASYMFVQITESNTKLRYIQLQYLNVSVILVCFFLNI